LIRNRGENYRLIQDFDKSIKDFTRVLELDSKNIFALTRRGEVYRMLRQGTKALRDLDEAIRIDPDNVMARESRGAMNRTLRRFEESLRDLDEAIYLNPNSVFALSNPLNMNEKALLDLEHALNHTKDKAFNIDYETKALCNRGSVLAKLGNYDEALADLNKVLTRDPNNAFALNERGA
ncbi:720_t:CDS:2, partial [Cetraspora pellucida]